MSTTDQHPDALPFPIPEGNDEEMRTLIASWRYSGPAVEWDAIVGHVAQIQRCRELVEKLRRAPEDLARLRIRVGAGLVISGPSGVGKSLMARALATSLGRDVIVVPTSELTAESIRRLYAQLVKEERPVVLLLDEAEALIGPSWASGADPAAQRSLLAALDGIDRPALGPITVALTTTALEQLEEAAVRPGRLAPRLVLEAPSAEERATLFARAIEGIPLGGVLDSATVVDRTAGWTGAELTSAVEEACARSLVDQTDALRQDLLLDVISERYVVRDEHEEDEGPSERLAVHEAGHVLFGYLNFPGGVVSVELHRTSGHTQLDERLKRTIADGTGLHKLAEMALAGDVAELICYGQGGRTSGSESDKTRATELFLQLLQTRKPYVPAVLESGGMSDHGSERMRGGWHAELEALAAETHASVLRWLTPHGQALRDFARLLLEAPDQALSGDQLEAAIEACLPGAVSGLYGEAGDEAAQ